MQRGTPNMKKADMSPNGGDMTGRGSPAPGMMDPSAMNPAMRQQMMMMPNGQGMRPPSSHPAMAGLTPQQQMEMMQRGMMPNGGWQGQQPPPGMMQGGQPGGPGAQPGQGPPNMTPRQGNMPPPPAPPAAGTQPSSPAQQAQPPTPVQANKAKPGGKKDNKKVSRRESNELDLTETNTFSQGGNKKGTAAASNDTADANPPTPTPPPPVTPSNAASFNQNKQLQMPNGGPGQQQGQQQHNGPQQQQQNVQQQQQDMSNAPFGDLGGDGTQFGNMDFATLDSGDVLDNFDFDSFLNNNDEGGLGFDANFAFGDSIEADI
jgi:hypothetical protein